MGPTNVALVKLFRADQALRDAQERLDAATKSVRVQNLRCTQLAEKLKLTQATYRESQVRGANLELDMKAREEQVERLRTAQQGSKNNKEYQTLLVEINTRKVDKAKVEEEAIRVMEQVETTGTELAELTTSLVAERAKAAELDAQVGDTVTQLQAEIDSLQGPRDEIAATVPAKDLAQFEKLADHHDGEAMAPITQPDARREEYACGGCSMGLVTDVYNKLHTRDVLVFCSSCRRILYIPADLPVETAVTKKVAGTRAPAARKPKSTGGKTAKVTAPAVPPRPKTQLDILLTAAQGESVKNAVDADQRPIEFVVTIDGKPMGQYKGKSADNLQRIIRFRMEELNLRHEIVINVPSPDPAVEAEQPVSTV